MTLVGFDLRFDPGLRQVRALLAEGVIGRVVAVQAQVGQYLPDWHPWEDYRTGGSARRDAGGGVILDLIHELDYVTWLNGAVTEVACMGDTVSSLEIETEDVAALLLRFANGSIGTLHLDYVQRSPSRTCRVIGEEGTICWDYFGREVRWHTVRTGKWEQFQYAKHDRNDRFREEMAHLLDCHARKERPVVDAIEGSKVLRLALAAKEAAVRGCSVSGVGCWEPATGLCEAARS
jgi:predicted dehydrogenase